MNIKMDKVQSSNIWAIGYDSIQHILWVKFNSGSLYCYYDVPQTEYDYFRVASSKGKYLWRNIRDKYIYSNFSDNTAKLKAQDAQTLKDRQDAQRARINRLYRQKYNKKKS